MFAMLFAMTSRLVCWASMPVAAMASALMCSSSNQLHLHLGDFEEGRDDLVANGNCSLEGLLRLQHGIDDFARGSRAFDAGKGHVFRALQAADGFGRHVAHDGGEAHAAG